jgi:serine/threonine-protein kinase
LADLSPSEELLRDVAHADDLAPLVPAAKLVGERIGPFRLLGLLGQGGMGVVYRAEDETQHCQVALKLLAPSHAGDDENRRRRLLREARAVAALNHPNLVVLHDVGEADGRVYIAMELVQGQNLAVFCGKGQVPIPEALTIMEQILRGLECAHNAGFVHRDIKPDNIMITDNGFVKVIDFGLAKRHEQSLPDDELERAKVITSLTERGSVLGTPSYMSPEQARGVAVDARADLFSCGVVLHEMLAGQRPFVGNTPADVISAILRDEPLPISTLHPDAPLELSQIVTKCLEKLPEKRYQTAIELADDIARCLRQWRLHKNEYSPTLHMPNTLVGREHESQLGGLRRRLFKSFGQSPKDEPTAVRPHSIPPVPAGESRTSSFREFEGECRIFARVRGAPLFEP